MLTYNFTDIGSDPLYEYLYKCIKKDILSGKIKAGEKLPSKRSFAKNLGISVVTVEGAYEMLMAEGYIYSVPKKGFYVTDFSHTSQEVQTVDSDRVILSGGDSAFLADFASSQTDLNIFPFSIWAKTMREVMAENQRELMVNPPCGGIMQLREAISKYLSEFRGMSVRPEQIIVGAGTEYLYSLLIQILGRHNVYGIENPGYHKSAKIYKQLEVPYVYIDIDNEGVPVSALEEKKVNVIHTSPAHHFPTGLVMPISRRYELLGWAAREEDRYIIEDEYDSELRLAGKPLPTLRSIDVSGKVIYMNTFTKTLCSTVRISYMVLPENLAERFYKNLSFYSCTVSNFEQYTLARFMENGSFEKHINRLRNYYQRKRDRLLDIFCSHPLYEHVKIYEHEAGVHFLMEVKTDKTQEDVIKDAKARGVRLCPISDYYCEGSQKPENLYVMNYSSIAEENMHQAADIIYEAII